MNVSATDDQAVSNVELYVDDVLYDQNSSGPYDFLLDTDTLSEEQHILKAVAYDTSGNTDSCVWGSICRNKGNCYICIAIIFPIKG